VSGRHPTVWLERDRGTPPRTEGNLRGARAVVCRAVVRHRKETVRSRLQVVHSGSERRQKINFSLSTWVDRALTLPRSSTSATRSARPVWLRRRRAIITRVHDGRPRRPPPHPQTCLPLRLQMEKMSENPRLRRPCSPSWAANGRQLLSTGRLHFYMRGMISRQSASWRNLDHRRFL
jgi:hypothetical protein